MISGRHVVCKRTAKKVSMKLLLAHMLDLHLSHLDVLPGQSDVRMIAGKDVMGNHSDQSGEDEAGAYGDGG